MVKARTRHPKLLSKPSDQSFRVSFVAADRLAQNAGRGEQKRRDIDFEQISVLPRKLTALVIFIAFVAAVVGSALLIFGDQINQWF